MTLDTFFSVDSVFCGLSVTNKKQLFTEMATRLTASKALQEIDVNIREIVIAALERERLGSTGVGTGVAVPHAKLDGLDKVYGGFALLDTPIDYDAVDGRPVDLVAMLIAPIDSGSEYLRALAQVSRQLRRENIRARLRNAPNAQSLYISLTDEQAVSVTKTM